MAKSKNEELLEAVLGLTNRISNIEKKLEDKVEVKEDKVAVPEVEKTDPVPFEYKKNVADVLNKHFVVEVKNGQRIAEGTDGFQLIIVVPDKYSSATKDQKDVLDGRDIRVKMIPYHSGESGVREWAEKVLSSFPGEMQTIINEDRVKNTI